MISPFQPRTKGEPMEVFVKCHFLKYISELLINAFYVLQKAKPNNRLYLTNFKKVEFDFSKYQISFLKCQIDKILDFKYRKLKIIVSQLRLIS